MISIEQYRAAIGCYHPKCPVTFSGGHGRYPVTYNGEGVHNYSYFTLLYFWLLFKRVLFIVETMISHVVTYLYMETVLCHSVSCYIYMLWLCHVVSCVFCCLYNCGISLCLDASITLCRSHIDMSSYYYYCYNINLGYYFVIYSIVIGMHLILICCLSGDIETNPSLAPQRQCAQCSNMVHVRKCVYMWL